MSSAPEPVACTLTTKDAARQVVEWTDLRGHASSIERIEGGAAMTFTPELTADVEDLAAREASCCAFLSLVVIRTNDELRLEVTSDNPDAGPVIDLIAGLSQPLP